MYPSASFYPVRIYHCSRDRIEASQSVRIEASQSVRIEASQSVRSFIAITRKHRSSTNEQYGRPYCIIDIYAPIRCKSTCLVKVVSCGYIGTSMLSAKGDSHKIAVTDTVDYLRFLFCHRR